MDIRDARPEERNALSELHRRSSYVWEDDRVHLDANPDALGVAREAIDEHRVRVAALQEAELVGFSVIAVASRSVWVLEDLFVEPSWMRRGIGRALVEDAAARAPGAGALEMTVVAHPRNFAFYESVGFVRGEPAETRFGPATKMRRQLITGRD